MIGRDGPGNVAKGSDSLQQLDIEDRRLSAPGRPARRRSHTSPVAGRPTAIGVLRSEARGKGSLVDVNFASLQPFGAAFDNKRNPGALIQRTITFLLDGAVVYEDILAVLALDESVSLVRVKPLDRACFSHALLSF